MVSPDLKSLDAVEAVVIGASAGAVGALGTLLPALDSSSKIPFVVVVHVPPHVPSLLVDLFGSKSSLPVQQPFDKQPVGRGIWVAAPNYHLMVADDRTFAVSLDEQVHFSRPSIDVLFESAADVFGPSLLAVVLTGASRDGATGARKVREAGGIVLVQDPEEAEIDIMPRAAIEEASPHLIATLSKLKEILRDVSRGRT